MLVIFEGMDKVGKSSLIIELNKATNFEHLVFDRGAASCLNYDELLERQTSKRTNSFLKYARALNTMEDLLVVYCYADESKVQSRLDEANEDWLPCSISYKEQQQVYEKYVKKCYFSDKIFWLDTTNLTLEQGLEKVLEEIKRRESID